MTTLPINTLWEEKNTGGKLLVAYKMKCGRYLTQCILTKITKLVEPKVIEKHYKMIGPYRGSQLV